MFFVSLVGLYGCQDLVPRDAASLLIPRFQRSEILGLIAGFGTTFAAMPDLLAMLRRRSSTDMNPEWPQSPVSLRLSGSTMAC
jgi:MtN3 and saliva related transmembrane protein